MQRKFPKGIGYEFNLYDLPGAVSEDRTFLEDRLFKVADQRACDAVQAIIYGQAANLNADLRAAFTRLLISFHHRTPERVAEIRADMLREVERILQRMRYDLAMDRREPLPFGLTFETMAERWRQKIRDFSWGPLMVNLVNSDLVGPAIYGLKWATRQLPNSPHDLLLGDHPLIRTNGFAHPEGHIAVPLGPRLLFVAAQRNETLARIFRQTDNRIVRDANRETLHHAKRFVYGTGDHHAAFVERRLRRRDKPG